MRKVYTVCKTCLAAYLSKVTSVQQQRCPIMTGKKIIIVYGSLNSVPSPEGAAPAKVILETMSNLGDQYSCYSLYNSKIAGNNYDERRIKHIHPGIIDRFLLICLKLFLPYHKRKQYFNTGDDRLLLYYISASRKVFCIRPQGVIVHVGYGLVKMIKIFAPSQRIIFYHHGTSLHSKMNEAQWIELDKNTVAIIGVNDIALEKANQEFSYKISPKKYYPLHNAIFPFFPREELTRKKIEAREELKISSDNFMIIYSGRICKEKGVLNLIKAFEIVIKRQTQVDLFIIGGPGTKRHIEKGETYIEACKEYCETKKLPVIFTGFLNRETLKKYLIASDLVVLPTDPSLSEEGLSLSLLEALSLGKPVIATDSGGNKEVVSDNQNGFIIPNTSDYYQHLADRIEILSQNRYLYQTFSNNALDSFYVRFSYDRFMKEFHRTMKKVGFE